MKDYLFYPLALSKPFGRLAQFCRRHMPLDAAKCIVPSLCTFLVFLAVGVWQGPGMANIAYGLWNGFWMSLAMFRAPIRKHLRLSPEDPKKERWSGALSARICWSSSAGTSQTRLRCVLRSGC